MAKSVIVLVVCLSAAYLLSLLESQGVSAYPLSIFDVMSSDSALLAKMIDQYINNNMDQDFVNERIGNRAEGMSKEERCAQPMRKGFCRALISRYRLVFIAFLDFCLVTSLYT